MHHNNTHIVKYIFSTGLIFICFLTLKAQYDFRDGYFIKNNDDTIHGLIDYKGRNVSAKKCIYRVNVNSKNQVFKPDQIKAYRYTNSKYYVSKFVDTGDKKEYIFLEFLINGIVDIYYYHDDLGDHYFIDDGSGNLYALKNEDKEIIKDNVLYTKESKEYVGVLRYTFKDSPTVSNQVQNISLDHKSLLKITQEYHNEVCTDEECIIYEKKLPKKKHAFGLLVGLNGITISEQTIPPDHYYLMNSNFGITFFPSIGFYYKVNMPQVNESLYFQYEGTFYYRKLTTSNCYKVEIYYNEYLNDITLKQLVFDNVALLKYEFPKGQIRPTFQIGGFLSYSLMTDYNRYEEKKSFSGYTQYTYETNESPFLNFDYGISCGVGLKIIYLKDKELFVDFKYKRGFGLLEGLNTNTFLMNVGLQIGK